MREWVVLFNEPRPSFEVRVISWCIEFLALFWQERVMYTEVDVHTVYQRLFKKTDKGLHPMQHIPYFACLS